MESFLGGFPSIKQLQGLGKVMPSVRSRVKRKTLIPAVLRSAFWEITIILVDSPSSGCQENQVL